MRRRPIISVLSSLLLVAGASCVSDDSEDIGWTGSVDTLESGRILVRNPDLPLSSAPTVVTEVWRVGALDGQGPDVFGEIRDIELDADGHLYVLDGQASEVRVFGPDGEFLRRFGGPGEGPGELKTPAGSALDSDGLLWIMNWGNARYTSYDPATGQLVSEPRRQATFTAIPWPGIFDSSGRLVDLGLDRAGDPTILRLDTAFTPRDTLPLPESRDEHRIAFRRDGVMVMSTVDPFYPQPTWAPRPEGGIVIGKGSPYRIHRVQFGGDTTLTFEIARKPERVTAEERDSALARFDRIAESAGGAIPDRRPRIADTKALHGAIFVDDLDRTWSRAGGSSDAVWDVVASDGRFIGQVVIPSALGPRRATVRSRRLAVIAEPGGVPSVVVYDLPEWL